MTGPFPLLFQCVFYDIDDLCSFSDFRAWFEKWGEKRQFLYTSLGIIHPNSAGQNSNDEPLAFFLPSVMVCQHCSHCVVSHLVFPIPVHSHCVVSHLARLFHLARLISHPCAFPLCCFSPCKADFPSLCIPTVLFLTLQGSFPIPVHSHCVVSHLARLISHPCAFPLCCFSPCKADFPSLCIPTVLFLTLQGRLPMPVHSMCFSI